MPAASGSLDWACLQLAIDDAKETFRRSTEGGVVRAQPDIGGIGGRAMVTQRPVCGPGVALIKGVETLGEVGLIAGAGTNFSLNLLDALSIFFCRDQWLEAF